MSVLQKICVALSLCLSVNCAVAPMTFAQKTDFMQIMRSEMNRRYHKSENRVRYWAMWEGQGGTTSVGPLMDDAGFRSELGLTEDQYAQIDFMYSKNGSMGHWYRTKALTNPELAAVLAEHQQQVESIRDSDDPNGLNMPEEKIQEFIATSEEMTKIYYQETQKDIENLLSPEQMQTVRESELALISEIPILNPSMFQSLDLTAEQKEQMEAIKKELEPEFEKIVEELVHAEDEFQQLKFDLFEQAGMIFDANGQLCDENGKPLRNDPVTMRKKMQAVELELAKHGKIQTKMKGINDKASQFMNGFKLKMLDNLSDEQLEKMRHIIENPTEYVKRIRNEKHRQRVAKEKENEWQPGIDSWHPGDPLPEEYLKKRKEKKAFPAREASAP